MFVDPLATVTQANYNVNVCAGFLIVKSPSRGGHNSHNSHCRVNDVKGTTGSATPYPRRESVEEFNGEAEGAHAAVFRKQEGLVDLVEGPPCTDEVIRV